MKEHELVAVEFETVTAPIKSITLNCWHQFATHLGKLALLTIEYQPNRATGASYIVRGPDLVVPINRAALAAFYDGVGKLLERTHE